MIDCFIWQDLVYLVVCQEEAFADSDKEKTASKCFGLNIRGFITKTFDDLEKASVTVKPNHSLQDHYACFTVSANFETALTPIHSKHGNDLIAQEAMALVNFLV